MSKQDFRVLFVCKKRVDSYGISFGLLNSAKMLANSLNDAGIEAAVSAVDDANGIDRVVHLNKPTHAVIHALWVTPAKMEELCRKHPRVSWNIRIHSKPPFLAMEGIASDWIADYAKLQAKVKNLWMSANSCDTDDLMENVFKCKSLMLPNTYTKPYPNAASGSPSYPSLPVDKKIVRIACFGAIRPLKNHYAQGAAAIMYGNKCNVAVEFHVNKGREEQGGDRVTKNLRAMFAASGGHTLVEHQWYPQDVLVYDILPLMDVGMQVSLTETFNIVAADMVSAGVPTIGSPDIYWMSPLFHADPNDLNNMVRAIGRARAFGRVGVWLNRMGLRGTNSYAIKRWETGLKTTVVI